MKKLISIFLILQFIGLFAQDIIVTKNKELINANIIYIKFDTIKYVNLDYSLEETEFIPKDSIYGIKYKNGDYYKISKKGLSVRQTIINIKRIQKKGWYLGFYNIIGAGNINHKPIYDYGENYYTNNQSTGSGIVLQPTIYIRYYVNNVVGLTFGVGYYFNKFEQYTEVVLRGLNTFNTVDYPYKYEISRTNYINSAVIPINISFSPGNKFGFYAEVGGLMYIPLSATYEESVRYVGMIKTETTEDNYINEISKYDFYTTFMCGFHATIKKKYMLYVGAIFSSNNKSASTESLYGGFKFGISYKLNSK